MVERDRRADDQAHPPRRALGVRVIIIYKLAKSGLQLVMALALFRLASSGLAARAHEFAVTLGRESASAWSAALMEALSTATTPHGAHVVSAALAADALLSFIEGWSLHHGYRWAPWLVVGVTASLVPFEIRDLVRHGLRPTRVVILVINVAMAVYLSRRARRGHRGCSAYTE
ncbi:hypothetical protein BE17_41570 [Sorangium cellulosum]|uniref:DUF2127 domain-containing protein n=1 Tax=Sorangium cellulosum TaxID=56 RepID=A0A150STH8_SORCE|nr:hypothetical protein BE17_41570 [Sorangium cellulosum]